MGDRALLGGQGLGSLYSSVTCGQTGSFVVTISTVLVVGFLRP
jgi:hypothetical protein